MKTNWINGDLLRLFYSESILRDSLLAVCVCVCVRERECVCSGSCPITTHHCFYLVFIVSLELLIKPYVCVCVCTLRGLYPSAEACVCL